MIILRCTIEPQQLSDSFIIHYSTISWNWHCCFDQSQNRAMIFWKKCFIWFLWQTVYLQNTTSAWRDPFYCVHAIHYREREMTVSERQRERTGRDYAKSKMWEWNHLLTLTRDSGQSEHTASEMNPSPFVSPMERESISYTHMMNIQY